MNWKEILLKLPTHPQWNVNPSRLLHIQAFLFLILNTLETLHSNFSFFFPFPSIYFHPIAPAFFRLFGLVRVRTVLIPHHRI